MLTISECRQRIMSPIPYREYRIPDTGPILAQGPRKSPGPGNRGLKGPGFQGYALPKAVALVSPARRAQTFKILGFFSEAEEVRLQYKTGS